MFKKKTAFSCDFYQINIFVMECLNGECTEEAESD